MDKNMKNLLATSFLSVVCLGAWAAEIKAPTPQQALAKPENYSYGAGGLTLESFGTYRAHALDGRIERFGAGLGLEYMLAENISVEPYFVSEGLHLSGRPFGDSFTDAGLNFRGYLPLGGSGLAGYGLIGYSHGFTHRPGQSDDDRMAAGVGLSLRGAGKVLGLRPGAFVDAVWLNNFRELGHALLRIGLSASF